MERKKTKHVNNAETKELKQQQQQQQHHTGHRTKQTNHKEKKREGEATSSPPRASCAPPHRTGMSVWTLKKTKTTQTTTVK